MFGNAQFVLSGLNISNIHHSFAIEQEDMDESRLRRSNTGSMLLVF